MSLLTSRRLAPLLVTQTLGALNDNLFKNALVVLILFRLGEASGPALVALAGGVFILPYLLFSATAGQIADKFEKSRTIFYVKLWEVALMVLAAVGFSIGDINLLFAVLFGLGIQATFFSPLKYSILPSALAETELVAGNGLIEAGTFLGILAGTIAGSALFALQDGPLIVSVTGLAVAAAGAASALLIPRAPSSTPKLRIGLNLVAETARLLRVARANRPVWLSLLGLSWFWTIGAIVIAELPTLVKNDLHAQPPVFTLLLIAFSLGIGTGSTLCSRLLHGEVSPKLVPFAALGLDGIPGRLRPHRQRHAGAANHCRRAAQPGRLAHAARPAAARGLWRSVLGAAVCHDAGAFGARRGVAHDRGQQHRQRSRHRARRARHGRAGEGGGAALGGAGPGSGREFAGCVLDRAHPAADHAYAPCSAGISSPCTG